MIWLLKLKDFNNFEIIKKNKLALQPILTYLIILLNFTKKIKKK